MPWWSNNNIRMIQNNIRDIDAQMDIDSHIRWLKSFHANTLQIGAGGITAFYPTQLTDCQWPNPYMKGDFLGEVVQKAHDNGIRVIVRFDFSKTHESFYQNNKGWYSLALDGSPIRYHDTVATCINGEYQQKHSLRVIEEVLTKYPVDGIFFNMFGYVTKDYSGDYVGICQCENCKQRFGEMYGEALPTREDPEDPVFQKYTAFKSVTVQDILEKIRALTKSINPQVAISTYVPDAIDIVRNESNSAVDRPLPFWLYQSSDNVAQIAGSYSDKLSSNVVINAIDIIYRFMGTSDYLNRIRLYGNMAAGGCLDWCIIGNFDDYPDHENFDGVREVFGFHEKYEDYYGHFAHKTKIALVSTGLRYPGEFEYRGIFRMLKEEHIPFTVLRDIALPQHAAEFDDYDFIILPDIAQVDDTVAQALKTTTACVIATKASLSGDPALVEALFGARLGERVDDVHGTYFRPQPREVFPDFHQRKWIYLDKPYYKMTPCPGARALLPKVEKARFGPPERSYGHVETDEPLAVSANGNYYLPWELGTLYDQHGYVEFRKLLLDLMGEAKPIPRPVTTTAPEMLELFYAKIDASRYMLQMLNLTGYNGTTFSRPLPLDFEVAFHEIAPARITQLCPDGEKPVSFAGKTLNIHMDGGELYKAFVIDIT